MSSDTQKNTTAQKACESVTGEQKWDIRGRPGRRSCHNIFRGSQIWDSYHVNFTFVLASWTRGWDCWTFHTQAFTHTVLCSVKLPSDVVLSEQWLSERSPWGLSHLCRQEHPGGDVCCLVWILMNVHPCFQPHWIWSDSSSDQNEVQPVRSRFTGHHLRVKLLKKHVAKAKPAPAHHRSHSNAWRWLTKVTVYFCQAGNSGLTV